MPVQVVFNEYIDHLKIAEAKKPVDARRRIPSMAEFAEHVGLTPTGFSKVTNNRTKGITKEFMDGVIGLLRSCGFSTTFNDIFVYIPDEQKADNAILE